MEGDRLERLLTEIRDELRAEREARRTVVEQSLRLQRMALRRQGFALLVLLLLMAVVLTYLFARGR